MPSLLFLCTANQIRSPFAAAYFQKLLEKEKQTNGNWTVDSAGTWAMPEMKADPSLKKLGPMWDLNFNNHKTKRIEQHMLTNFDLILVMEKGQKEALHYEFPQFANKIYMLTEICSTPYDFPDPQGLGIDEIEKCLKEIANFLEGNFKQIYKKAIR